MSGASSGKGGSSEASSPQGERSKQARRQAQAKRERRSAHSASCPLTFYEKKSSLSGKWRRPGVWPGAPKREIRDLGVI